MRLLFKILCLYCTLVLASCASTEPIVVYKSILLSPPDTFLVDCDVEPPPNKEEYKLGNEKYREKLLFVNANKQMTNVFVCNGRFSELRKWKKQQEEFLGKIMPVQ